MPFGLSPIIGLALFGIVYFVAAAGAIELSGQAGNIAGVWIASAVLLAALIKTRWQAWPYLLAVAAGADLAANLTAGSRWDAAAVVAVADMAEPLIILAAIHRWREMRPWYLSTHNLFLFTAAVILSCATVSFAGSVALAQLNAAPFLQTWQTWAIADALGILIAVPLLLSWTDANLRGLLTRRRAAECLLLAALVAIVTILTFAGSFPFLFLVFPFLVLITLRTGVQGATAGVCVVAAIAIWLTLQGLGPIATAGQLGAVQQIQVLQLYILTCVLSSLPLAVILAARRDLDAELRKQVEIRAQGQVDEKARQLEIALGEADRLNRELTTLNASLERRVREEIKERMEAQEALRQAQKLESMGQLTGGVAHDFNNLLTPIIGGLDLLHRRGLGGERERLLLDAALKSAEKAKLLVHRLLAFARRQPLQAKPVDVRGLIEGMAELITGTLGPRVKVKLDLAVNLPFALADANQLEMALLNLAVNARDAMVHGGLLTISAEAEQIGEGHRSNLSSGPYVLVSVSDTGPGMDAETVQKAIEPFFSTKGVGKGTGLGLSMVHGLVSQLGGALLISSKPGIGTEVELWIPVSASPVESGEDLECRSRRPSKPGTVLLVDDDDAVRATIADMLKQLGYNVVEAASALEAMRLLDAGLVIDTLVTDHLMPGMTGADLARAVRKNRPATCILIISGYAEEDGVAPDLPRLTKPFRQEDLAGALLQ